MAQPTSDAPAAGSAAPADIAPRATPFVPRLEEGGGEPAEEWLLSYADMVTLLLTMFIALLLNARFDKPEAGKIGLHTGANIVENLLQLRIETPYEGDAAMGLAVSRQAGSLYAQPDSTLAVVKDNDLDRIRAREAALTGVRAGLRDSGLDAFITAAVEADGIRLNIPNSILFNSGAADLQGRGPSVIKALGPILNAGKFIVAVEGHTDNNPISTERFPSNWELSASRAAAVVRVLIDAGVDVRRLQAVGYADSRPLTDNATEDGRAENRRVALFLGMP
ncbi:MAG: OmpA family protein [Rhodospirillaceae bacterium]